MNDEYVEEIRRIRERQYEETKNMTLAEKKAYTQIRSEEIERRVAECRARKSSEKQSEQQKTARR